MNDSWDHFTFKNIPLRETDLLQKAYLKHYEEACRFLTNL